MYLYIVTDGNFHSHFITVSSDSHMLSDRDSMVPSMHRPLWTQRGGFETEAHDWMEKVSLK